MLSQEVVLIPMNDGFKMFVSTPISTLQFNEKNQENKYQLNITLFDNKGNPLHQQSNTLVLSQKDYYADAALLTLVNYLIEPFNYRAIINLRNPVLGDKREKQFIINQSTQKGLVYKSILIADNGNMVWFPSSLNQLSKDLTMCKIIHSAKYDSTIIHYKKNNGDTDSYISQGSNEIDLLPVIVSGDINSIEIFSYKSNFVEKMKIPLYHSSSSYNSIFSLRDQLQQIKYIASQNEWQILRTTKDSELERNIELFWERHNNNPAGFKNEFREAFYSRVLKSEEMFTIHKKIPGWKSDRGMIYIKYGPPDEVYEELFPAGKVPYIKWYYYKYNKVYLFTDRSGYGNYKLWEEYYEN